jgi:hypothetical protein
MAVASVQIDRLPFFRGEKRIMHVDVSVAAPPLLNANPKIAAKPSDRNLQRQSSSMARQAVVYVS